MQLVGEGGETHVLLVLLAGGGQYEAAGGSRQGPQDNLISEARRSQPIVG